MKFCSNMTWSFFYFIYSIQVAFAGILVKRVCVPDSCLINVAGISAASPQLELAIDDCSSFLGPKTSTNMIATS
jgi:hypothetical protein